MGTLTTQLAQTALDRALAAVNAANIALAQAQNLSNGSAAGLAAIGTAQTSVDTALAYLQSANDAVANASNFADLASTEAASAAASAAAAAVSAQAIVAAIQGAATAANQTSANTTLASILGILQAQRDITALFVTDGTSFYVRRESVNEGSVAVSFVNIDGTAPNPAPVVSNLHPVSGSGGSSVGIVVETAFYDVVTAAAGYAATDILARALFVNTTTQLIVGSSWQNLTQGTTISAPIAANIKEQIGGAATQATLQAVLTALSTVQPRAIASNAPPVDATGALSASGDLVGVACTGMNTAIISVPSGSWTGTIIVEASAKGDYSDVITLAVLPYGGGASASAITAPGIYEVTITALASVRARATTPITGGPVTALVRAATGNKSIRVGAPANNPVPVALSTTTPLPSSIVNEVTVVPVVTAISYTTGKSIGGMIAIAGIMPAANNYAGLLESITITFKNSLQTCGLFVSVFGAAPTGSYVDDQTIGFVQSDGAVLKGTYYAAGGNNYQSALGNQTVYNLDGIGKALRASSGTLYLVITPDGPTAALGSTSDMSVTVAVV